MDIKELAELLQEKGITGAGGAGFPTYAKLDKRADTIILNCAECEPLLKVHRQLLQSHAYEIMSALEQVANAVEATRIIIALKESYQSTIETVSSQLDSFPGIELKAMKERYPLGDEVVLIYEALGKVVPPGSLPIEAGVTVFNVETMYNIYLALNHREPVTDTYLTIAGEVKNPITVKVPIGMTVYETVELAGGSLIEAPAYLMGGPMTGNIAGAYDTITKTTNAILVLPANHSVINKKRSNTAIDMKKAMAACCQCEMCTDLCPRHELGQPVAPHKFMRAATSGTTREIEPLLNIMFCCGCGVCEMYACPQGLSPRKLITEYKNGLRQNGVGIPKDVPLDKISPMREYRMIPMERLISRLGLKEYDAAAPLSDREVKPKQVKIKLSQHIGVPARPVVKKDAIVKKGDLIAVSREGVLSLPVHASIGGKVTEVNDNFVIIREDIQV